MSDEARRTPEAEPAPPAGTGTVRRMPGPVTPHGPPLVGEPAPHARPAVRVYGGGDPATPLERAMGWGALSGCFLSIWTHPRETIRRIVSVNPRHGVLLLAVLGGGNIGLVPWRGDAHTLVPVLVRACVVGPLLAIAWLWLGAWLVGWLGRVAMRGRARSVELRAALAWAYVPQVAFLPVALAATLWLGPHALQATSGPGLAFEVAAATFSGVGLLIASNTVAEVQGYTSAWRGLWNVVLTLLVVFTGLTVLFQIAIRVWIASRLWGMTP